MRVARAFGQEPLAVADAPFAVTAWTLLQLLEVERLEEIERDAEGLRAAERNAIAFNEPKHLKGEREALRKRITTRDRWDDLAAARARGRALAERLTKGRVLA